MTSDGNEVLSFKERMELAKARERATLEAKQSPIPKPSTLPKKDIGSPLDKKEVPPTTIPSESAPEPVNVPDATVTEPSQQSSTESQSNTNSAERRLSIKDRAALFSQAKPEPQPSNNTSRRLSFKSESIAALGQRINVGALLPQSRNDRADEAPSEESISSQPTIVAPETTTANVATLTENVAQVTVDEKIVPAEPVTSANQTIEAPVATASPVVEASPVLASKPEPSHPSPVSGRARPTSMRIAEMGKGINVGALNPFGPRPVFAKPPVSTPPPVSESVEEGTKEGDDHVPVSSDMLKVLSDANPDFNHVNLSRPARPKTVKRATLKPSFEGEESDI